MRKKVLSVEDSGGKISLSGVWQQGDNGLPGVFGALSELHRRPHRRAGGDAGKDALFPCQRAGLGEGVLSGDGDDLVYHAQVEDLRHIVRADALQGMRPCVSLRQQRRGGGFHANEVDGWVVLLEVAPYAGDRAPVPMPATKTSTWPRVSAQISGPVEV